MKLLFTTLPTNDLGLLTRSLPIARELAGRGHDVVFSSPARAPDRLVSDAGFRNLVPPHPLYDLLRMEPGPRGLARLVASRPWTRYGGLVPYLRKLARAVPVKKAPATPDVWDADHAGAMMGMLDEGFVRAGSESLMETMAASEADVVVDFWNPLAVIAARALKLPLVTVIQADAHPRSNGFIWWRPPPPGVPTPVPVVNRVLARHGLPAVEKLADLSVGDLTLVVGTPDMDPLPEDAGVTWVGPVLWQGEGARLPAWIEALGRGRPVVWVYSGNPRYGSAGQALDSAVVLRASVAALAGEDVQVVLTTGHHALPRELSPLPANFRHEAYVPGLAMAERCDLLVHHGGYGSCQTGLFAGKPAVILPTFSERESNARRLAALGAGVVVPVASAGGEKHVRAEELRSAVRRVLADPSFGERARSAAERLRAFGGAREAADRIESFGAGAVSSPRAAASPARAAAGPR